MIGPIRRCLLLLLGFACVGFANHAQADWKLATFKADITPRLGHPLLGGQFAPAKSIADPLFAKGLVILGPEAPVVMVAVDWCELRNDAFARWRSALAEAAGTTIDRVIVSSVHQHDAPYFDLKAQELLAASPEGGLMCDADFHERAVQNVAKALKSSIATARPITHFGLGQAKVEQVASNRRVVMPDGKVNFRRLSQCRDPLLRELGEGEIDPWLKTLSFWNGDEPVCALSSYACHPMSYYGRGDISSDFVGAARERREADDPHVFQIYMSGCSGDVTAGKYNDGATSNRPVLTDRLYQGMLQAWKETKKHPLEKLSCRSVPMVLPHSELAAQSAETLQERVKTDKTLYRRAEAAMGLSNLARGAEGHQIDVQVVDFGPAQLVLLPAESFVAYQLMAQKVRPDSFVMALGFGECAPGYIPTDAAFREGYREEHGYCWVRPGAEKVIAEALQKALAK